MKIAQKIGILWLSVIDSNQALFLLLKPLHIILRYSFYSLLIIGTFSISKFVLSLVEPIKDISLYIALIPTIGVSFILFYEAIFNLDIQKILKERQEKKQLIKATKAQKWRLRNIPFLVRIILYLTLYIILQQLLQLTSMIAFFESMPQPTQAQINEFINQFQSLLKSITVTYILMLATLEYFISKRKANQCLKS